jgi:hypothetical protein
MKLVAVLFSLALATGAQATIYRGKVWSSVNPGALQFRSVVAPSGTTGLYVGRTQCRSLSPAARCLTAWASVEVQFYADGSFDADLARGLCTAVGTGNPYSGGLAGAYACVNGDYGSFYWRRVR